MRTRAAILTTCAAVALASAHIPARATSLYDYKAHEYRIVHDGLAPDKRLSISAHGGRVDGYKGFHLYLMAEPSHRKIAVLDSIGPDNILDTGAEMYHAVGSPDSRHVAVIYRLSHQNLAMLLYEIRGRRLAMLPAPSLFSAVARPLTESSDGLDLKSNRVALTWLSATTFVMKERQVFHVSTHDLAQKLGAYGNETVDTYTKSVDADNKPVTWYFVDFSAEAVCRLIGDHGYRIVSVKPGRFD
jgi:hypothetical protein